MSASASPVGSFPAKALLISFAIAAFAFGLQWVWLGLVPRIIVLSETFHAGLIVVAAFCWLVSIAFAIKTSLRWGWLAVLPAPLVLYSLILMAALTQVQP